MKRTFLAFAVITGIACLAGCGAPTTGAEIDRIMAEARKEAAIDLAHSRNGANPAWVRQNAVTVATSS